MWLPTYTRWLTKVEESDTISNLRVTRPTKLGCKIVDRKNYASSVDGILTSSRDLFV